MDEKLLNIQTRQAIIQYINAQENVERKSQSLRDTEVYSGNIEPYVYERLCDKGYSNSTLQQTPIVSTINTCKRVVDQCSSVYKESPERTFIGTTEQQNEVLETIYEDMWFNNKMQTANRYFKLQQQTHFIVLPKNGKLTARVLKQHQLDVIPNKENPEIADVYILTGFDKSLSTLRTENSENGGDGLNSPIADQDDYKKTITRHVVWSKNYHFVMNGKGEILSEEIDNPIGMIPIVEISEDKDLVYFIQNQSIDSKFCVEYNEALTSQNMVVQNQGFSQAVLTAPEELMPDTITIGPTKILKLITNGQVEGETDFRFVTPNADLSGVRAHTESLLAQYLSSKGINPSTVTGQSGVQTATSGIEKLLSMVEKFEASKQDFTRFEQAEKMIFEIIKGWLNGTTNTDTLLPEYQVTIPESSEVAIKYAEPTAILSDLEKLDIAERKIDLGIWTVKDAFAYLEGVDKTQAEEMLDGMEEAQNNEEGSQSEI